MTSVYCGEFFPQQLLGWWPCRILLRWWEFESPLSSWHGYRLKKNTWLGRTCSESEVTQCAGSKIVPKKLNLQPFPSPSFSPLCRSSLHMSFLSCQFPGGVMMWVRPLLWSGLKITLPNQVHHQSQQIVYLHHKTLSSLTQCCARTEAENCVRCHFLRL